MFKVFRKNGAETYTVGELHEILSSYSPDTQIHLELEPVLDGLSPEDLKNRIFSSAPAHCVRESEFLNKQVLILSGVLEPPYNEVLG